MFINFTNHPSASWSEAQITEASKFGEIIDVPFPNVPESADEDEIMSLAVYYSSKIISMNPTAVLCQGEYSLCFTVASILIKKRIVVLCACSKRNTLEKQTENGSTYKETFFTFQRFREYQL
jgi:hypothetical protein